MPQALSAKQRVLARWPDASAMRFTDTGNWCILRGYRRVCIQPTARQAWAKAAAKLPARTGE